MIHVVFEERLRRFFWCLDPRLRGDDSLSFLRKQESHRFKPSMLYLQLACHPHYQNVPAEVDL